jgi:hypothetical protein
MTSRSLNVLKIDTPLHRKCREPLIAADYSARTPVIQLSKIFFKRKGQEPLWLKAFSNFFNTLRDRLV